jgi:hypothetical protein
MPRVRFPARTLFFFSPCRPDRLWSSASLLYKGYRELFARGWSGKQQGCESDHSSSAEIKNGGAIPPLPRMSFDVNSIRCIQTKERRYRGLLWAGKSILKGRKILCDQMGLHAVWCPRAITSAYRKYFRGTWSLSKFRIGLPRSTVHDFYFLHKRLKLSGYRLQRVQNVTCTGRDSGKQFDLENAFPH